ncbi:anhydro-N-acetylmuramic acid kinase [Pseudoroseomonas wenyumeiae]
MLRTIGLMSGTSLDGVDAAWVETDGERIGRFGPSLTLPYDPDLRRDLRRLLDMAGDLPADDPFLLDCEQRLTERHAEAVEKLALEADLIGFHGQTILHRPVAGKPGRVAPGRSAMPPPWRAAWACRWRMISAAPTSRRVGRAPLVPVFHAALAQDLPRPWPS